MRRTGLGRTYPKDIQDSIIHFGSEVDRLMKMGPALMRTQDIDITIPLSELNARLVNEVIIPSDQLSDDDARARLEGLFNELYPINSFANNNYIEPAPEGTFITLGKAKDLAGSFKSAYDLYGAIIDRYTKIKDGLHGATALPGVGLDISKLMSTMDQEILEIERSLSPVQSSISMLEGQLDGGSETVSFDHQSQVEAWIGSVYSAEELLKRLEAIANKKPARAENYQASGKTPWTLIAVAGLVLVGLAGWAILE